MFYIMEHSRLLQAESFEKVSFDPGSLDFQPLKIFHLADKKFLGDKNMPISTV